jgi:hypothetical protein
MNVDEEALLIVQKFEQGDYNSQQQKDARLQVIFIEMLQNIANLETDKASLLRVIGKLV